MQTFVSESKLSQMKVYKMLTGEFGLTASITRAFWFINRSYQRAHACSSAQDTSVWIPITWEPAHSQTLVSEIVSSSWIVFVAKGCPEFARTVDIRYTFPRNFVVDAGWHEMVTRAHRWNSRTTYICIHAKIAIHTILCIYRPCVE